MTKQKIVIFILITYVGVLVAFFLFSPTKVEKTHSKIEFLKDFYSDSTKDNYQMVFIGDSTLAFGVKPKVFQDSVSLAVPGFTMMNIDYEIDKYLKTKLPPKCVIVSTAYIEDYYDSYLWDMYVRNDFYNFYETMDFYEKSLELKTFPSQTYSKSFYALKAIWFSAFIPTIKSQMDIKDQLGVDRSGLKYFSSSLQRIRQEDGFIPFSRASDQNLVTARNDYLFKEFKSSHSEDTYLKIIDKKLSEKNIKLIYLMMPILNQNDLQVNAYRNRHLKTIQKILNDDQIVNDPQNLDQTAFRDISHLNEHGANIFSKQIRPILRSKCAVE